MKTRNYIITILITFAMTICLIKCFGYLNKSNVKEIQELNSKIEHLEDDKAFYKNLYINLAEEYSNETGVIILTDTSR